MSSFVVYALEDTFFIIFTYLDEQSLISFSLSCKFASRIVYEFRRCRLLISGQASLNIPIYSFNQSTSPKDWFNFCSNWISDSLIEIDSALCEMDPIPKDEWFLNDSNLINDWTSNDDKMELDTSDINESTDDWFNDRLSDWFDVEIDNNESNNITTRIMSYEDNSSREQITSEFISAGDFLLKKRMYGC